MRCFNLSLFLVALAVAVGSAGDRPNILVILCDDLGYGDLHCFGHPVIQSPNLDRLAADGIRFTDFYSASPVCSPSRVGLLTGRTPNRAGVYDWIPEYSPKNAARTTAHMRASEVTIPQLLKQAGYATCMAGKWHCNSRFNSPGQPQPGDFGFDHWFATQNNAAPSHENPVNFVRDGVPVGPLQGFSCQLVADEAIGWLRRHRETEPAKPFFLYLAFHEPHEPVASPPDLVAKYRPLAQTEDQAQFFANVENMDAAAGRLLAALDQLGCREDTLIAFSADNGPETLNRYKTANRSYGSPGPLRGMKLHTHEAGYRVAGIMRWPARIQPGQVSKTPVSSLDFLPTFCALAGATPPSERELDGANFLPALEGKPIERRKPLAWCYYNALNDARVAMRDGDWKILGKLKDLPKKDHLMAADRSLIQSTPFESFEIYRVSEDPNEEHDLARSPGVPLEALTTKLKTYYEQLVEEQPYWQLVP